MGHRVIESHKVLEDPISIQNNGTIPFEVIDGVYYSQNHNDYSSSEFTATALYDCSVNLIYGVSSESNYDKLYILKNGAQLDMISGSVSERKLTVELSVGDVLTLRYTKDVSVSVGEDRGWVKLEYDHVWIGEDVDVPADTLEPDCANGVICDYCGAVVKAALGHKYVNGICSVCGDIFVSITQKGRTLNYEDLIYVIDIFDLTGVEGIDLTKDAGLLIWSVEEFEALSEIAFDADHAKVGLKPYRSADYYCGSSDGIFTRDLYKEAYYVGYVKLADGSYVYSEPRLYSPAIYAYNMLDKDTTSAETKELCVALLNYISAAQVYFHGTAEADLVNNKLTDEQKTLNWENISFNLAPEVPADKHVAGDESVFKRTGKNLLFEEMISIVSIYMIDDAVIADAQEYGTIYWTAEEFAALEGAPSIDNIGSGTKTGMAQYRGNAGQWYSQAPEVAAKNMADTQYYYLGYVVHADGSVSYSGVISYTVEQYISNKVNDPDTSDTMLAFAQRLYHYERAAKDAIG